MGGGCRVERHYYGHSKFHMRVDYDTSGVVIVTRDGERLSSWNPIPDDLAWASIKKNYEERGGVIFSDAWVGWTPVHDCGTEEGDPYGSIFSISNLVISGSIVKGPEPTKCQSDALV